MTMQIHSLSHDLITGRVAITLLDNGGSNGSNRIISMGFDMPPEQTETSTKKAALRKASEIISDSLEALQESVPA